MDVGEFITRLTIWISVAAYTIGTVLFASRGPRSTVDSLVRYAWTIACGALAAHYISAFHFFHHWSHSAAYLETARQTEEVFKINWGGGLFINYAFLTIWIADVGFWWLRGLDSYRRRPLALVMTWHGVLLFIIFNATVVFKTGWIRWLGLLICLTVCLSLLASAKQWFGRRSMAIQTQN